MLTHTQATRIVFDSLKRLTTRSVEDPSLSLESQGVTSSAEVESFLRTIVTDQAIGISSERHYLDPSALSTITAKASILDVVETVELAARKLCSNPLTPHPQTYPYPEICPKCPYPVR